MSESLQKSAENMICALKPSKPEAMAEDYILAVGDAFGHLETGEDLFFQFQSCYQQQGEKLSS